MVPGLWPGAARAQTEDPRLAWGRAQLGQALLAAGYAEGAVDLKISADPAAPQLPAAAKHAEGFALHLTPRAVEIAGYDAAGALYGCLEAVRRLEAEGALREATVSDAPKMTLRGPCFLLMKLGSYNYPVSPEEFPFFYDRTLWREWLDFMAAQRFNFIVLWNGHPFAYFVKFDRYPEAQAGMEPGLVERNREMLHWLVDEGRKRNIRFLFEFYNIHTSVYFREAHNLPEENIAPTPLLRDYTSYAVETFVREFPGVGLYITPGEAIELKYTDGWVNDVLFPAMERGGLDAPVMLRSWGVDLPHAQKIVQKHPDVWMERKYNVEMISGDQVDPQNRDWAALTGRHIVNIHMGSDIDPFLWWPPDYIRRCVRSAMDAGATALHLYPRRSWRWPDTAEPAAPLLQWQRDRLWFSVWGRYAWNPDRDPAAETAYWTGVLAAEFGDRGAAEKLLAAQEMQADVLPSLQRLLWLGDDNHTVISAGIRLGQLEHAPGIPYRELTDVAQRMPEFLATLRAGQEPPHPTPVEFVQSRFEAATRAVALAAEGAARVRRHHAEAAALQRDAELTQLVLFFYRQKLEAAVLRAEAAAPGGKVAPDAFLAPLEASLSTYRQLAAKATGAYDSVSDVPAFNPAQLKKVPYHWNDLVPLFERELDVYRQSVQAASGPPPSTAPDYAGLAGLLFGDPGLRKLKTGDPVDSLQLQWRSNDLVHGREWSAEWRGRLIWPRDGEVTLRVTADGPVQLSLDGQKVLDGTGFPGTREVRYSARAGAAVALDLAFDHPRASPEVSRLEVTWDQGGGAFVPLPASALRHSETEKQWIDQALLLNEL